MDIESYEFELTKRCNLKCDYCYLGEMTEKADLNIEVATNIINFIDKNINYNNRSKVNISFWGG